MSDELARVAELDKQYAAIKGALFASWADAVRAGHTAEEVHEHTVFSAVYIRKVVRNLGVPAMKPGPRPRKSRDQPDVSSTP